jgi:DNA-binding response OmpR family regulator
MDQETTILVVEDDRNLAGLLSLHLSDAGFSVDVVRDGTTGLKKAVAGGYALIILDLMLPGVDGLSICRSVREHSQYVPILIVSARSEEMDKVIGLELGADDYITKPFSPRELTARVKALLRRVQALVAGTESTNDSEALGVGDLKIDLARHRVFRGRTEMELTAKEFDLLVLLARHPGQAFNREQLLDRVWGYQHEGYNHTVNSHINRLRAKIEDDPSHPRFIRTVWGYGYRFAEDDEMEVDQDGAGGHGHDEDGHESSGRPGGRAPTSFNRGFIR